MTESEARHHLEEYYSAALGYTPALLHSAGPHLIPLSAPPHALSLFRKSVLVVHAPVERDDRRACVLAAHPTLLQSLDRFLMGRTVAELFEERALVRLSQLVRARFPAASILPGGALAIARFATPETFQPFQHPESAGIERLNEHVLENVLLVGRYDGGVYVLRDDQREIISRAGIRHEAAMVWEIGVRTEREDLRGRGLAKLVVTAATQAVLAAGRVPLYVHSATNFPSEKVALALGYQHYADELLWFLPE